MSDEYDNSYSDGYDEGLAECEGAKEENIRLRAELQAVTAERDALAARLAPVDDEALVEIAAREIAFAQGDVESPNSEFMDENWHCWEPEARAAISAIRPHIEAAERERCAKDIKPHFPHKSAEQIKKEIDQLIEKHKESVNAWLEAGSWKQSGAGAGASSE